jgi:hypothetical protein
MSLTNEEIYRRVDIHRDGWEERWLLLRKQHPEQFPTSLAAPIKATLEERLMTAETGMALGVGWHGGQTSEEWAKEKAYVERLLTLL